MRLRRPPRRSLTSLAAVVSITPAPATIALTVSSVFAHVTLKSHPQPVRNTVYTLLDHLMSHSRPALKRLGTEFLAGYCELVEGEKDPRNLMISFSLIRVMLLEFDVLKNIEVRPALPFFLTVEQPDLSSTFAGHFRRYLLLLPHYLHASARRPLRHLVRRLDHFAPVRSHPLYLSLPYTGSNKLFTSQSMPRFDAPLRSTGPSPVLRQASSCERKGEGVFSFAPFSSSKLINRSPAASNSASSHRLLPHLRRGGKRRMGGAVLGSAVYRGAPNPTFPSSRRLTCFLQVFHATDTAMQDLALASFRSLFSTLYPDSTPSAVSETLLTPGGEDAEMVPVEDGAEEKGDEKIVGIVVQVVENSLDEFKEPEKNNAKPAVRILTALIASSGASFRLPRAFFNRNTDHLAHSSTRSLRPVRLPTAALVNLQKPGRHVRPTCRPYSHLDPPRLSHTFLDAL